jgi:Thiol:disulfide interchange protein DsbD, N-terminal
VKTQSLVGGLLCTLALLGVASAQEFGKRQATVVYSPPELTSINRGHLGGVVLHFRIPSGYHINSNQPKQEYLKKTELKVDAPTDIAIAGVTYPPGEDRSFPFDPSDKLNVYTGDFALKVLVRPLRTVVPAKYAVHGVLKYQACDNAACYPPKQLPVSFEIKVLKAAAETVRHNPAQSPHAHK